MSSQSVDTSQNLDETTSTAATASAATTSGGGGAFNASSTISSLDQLKQVAPQVYQQLMISIGMSICHDMEQSQNRLKALMDEQRRAAGG